MKSSGPPRRGERPGFTDDEVEEIREAFNLFDTEGTGMIDPKELKAAMQSLGFQNKNPTVFEMISELESTRSGLIDFEEFLSGIASKLGDRGSPEGIRRIFQLFDDDRSGKISFKNLKRVAKELGERFYFSQCCGEGAICWDFGGCLLTEEGFDDRSFCFVFASSNSSHPICENKIIQS